MSDLPYRVEYAKTGRAGCKKCKNKIDQATLRIAAMVQSFHHDGKDPNWFHLKCFFEKHRPKTTDDIDHFESIRYEDQEKIRKKVEEMSGILLPETSKGKKGKKRAAESEQTNAALKDFGVEYSASSRAVCVGCQDKIMKDDIRVKKMAYDTEVGMKFGGQAKWHHLNCFVALRSDYGFYLGGEMLPGFSSLSPEDKKTVKKSLEAIKIDETQAKKLKAEPKDEVDLAVETALEESIKKQSKQIFKIRDFLQKLCTKADLQNILFANNSGMVEGLDNLLDRCADFLTFGALVKCQKCKKGDLIFAKHGYKCKGMLDEWAECGNFEVKPLRRKCQIPSTLKKDGDSFFSKYKSKVEDRAVRPGVPTAVKKEEEAKEARVSRKREPLYNMHVAAIGNLSMPKEEMKRTIERMGGKLVTKLQENIAVVISNADEVEKMNKRMAEVQSFNIQVVTEDFLKAIKDGNPTETIEKIKSMSISSWGSDPLARIPAEEVKGPKESMYSRNVSKTASIKLKNGSAIDPDSGLQDVAHVYRQDGTLYTSTLSFTDIQKNKNSYYKLQVLESDAGRKFWLFRAWGRIGTSVGDHKLESFPSAELACDQFETLFEEKTGNMFNAGISFKKVAGKYYPVEVDYDDDDKVKKITEKSAIKSKMPKQTQELIEMLFDVNQMKQTMMEFELDLDKMPLGRLSKKQLRDAYQVLTDLNALVVRAAPNNEFIGLSNKFFTLVPHNFGMNKAPVIDTLEMIQNKREILDNLIEVEIAYSMLQQDTDDKLNPLDAHYEQLKTELLPLDHKSEEFTLINRYVQNTHADTHDAYSLEVIDVFKVNRQGEKRRYKPFKNLHNRQLLWHGSRITNFVGILSHGLKIAPPEAPVTGYMFGKGIYFADMVSKSANYCCTTPQNNTGMMLLSEVALGDMHELKKATYIEKLPVGKHSVKGVGKTSPDEKETHVRADGVVIPLGKQVKNEQLRSDLLYNEYIVYDVAQANVQYLLKLKFNYKKRTR